VAGVAWNTVISPRLRQRGSRAVSGGSWQGHKSDRGLLEDLEEDGSLLLDNRGHEVQVGPEAQGHEDLEHRDVEAEGGQAQHHVIRRQAELLREPAVTQPS
jgi:hypothetical protein